MDEESTLPDSADQVVPPDSTDEAVLPLADDAEPATGDVTPAPERRGRRVLKLILAVAASVIVLVSLLTVAFVGGRVTAPDKAPATSSITTAADAIKQVQAGKLPCGTLSGSRDKTLQQLCGTKNKAGGKSSSSQGSSETSSDTSTASDSSSSSTSSS
jgi:hypothetical protein